MATATSSDSLRWRTTRQSLTATGGGGAFLEDFGLPSGIADDDVNGSYSSKRSILFGSSGGGIGGGGGNGKGGSGGTFLAVLSSILSPRQVMKLWICWYSHCTVHTVAMIAIVSSIVSIKLLQDDVSYIVYISSILCCVVALIIVLQQRTIKKIGSIKQRNNLLRKQVNYMKQERERLHRTLSRLDETSNELQYVPKQLTQLVKDQQVDVDRIVYIIKQQHILQEQMRNKITQQILQSILSIVVQSDRDGNWTLQPTEIEQLIVRLGLIQGITFHEKRFRQLLNQESNNGRGNGNGHHPTISSVMRIIRSLLERDDEYQQPPPIFEIKIKANRGNKK